MYVFTDAVEDSRSLAHPPLSYSKSVTYYANRRERRMHPCAIRDVEFLDLTATPDDRPDDQIGYAALSQEV